MQYVHFYYTPGLGGWCWGASHQRSAAVGARGAADQALAEAVGVEHVSARRDPRHVHRLQAHRTRGPRLLQLLLTRTRHTQPCGGQLVTWVGCLKAWSPCISCSRGPSTSELSLVKGT